MEVCGVETALMELDEVHNRQDFTSERPGRQTDGKTDEEKKEAANNTTD